MKYKVIFLGTPAFGAQILARLAEVAEVVLVVTQPDRARGRGKRVQETPVKALAARLGLPLYQPASLNKAPEPVLAAPCDFLVTAAYGQIIGQKLLDHPRIAALNVHGSLLPAYRGGAPVQHALLNGDAETGVTLMEMVQAMDAGPMYAQRALAIAPDDNATTLLARLAELGAQLLTENLAAIAEGKLLPVPQKEADVSYAYVLPVAAERIDFQQPAARVVRQIRALAREPGAYFLLDNFRFKVYSASVVEGATAPAGTIVSATSKGLVIACGDGAGILITEIQPAGRREMPFHACLNGRAALFTAQRRIE